LSFLAAMVELGFLASIGTLAWTLAPEQWTGGLYFFDWLTVSVSSDQVWRLLALAYLPVIVLVEPFYVGGGFGIYLNQRSRLEGWDLEPRLRSIVEHHQQQRVSP